MVFPTYQSLSVTPPSPPRDINCDLDDALQLLDTSIELSSPTKLSLAIQSSTLGLGTPPNRSPVSPAAAATPKATKRVDFSPWPPTYHAAPDFNIFSPDTVKSTLRNLPSKRRPALKPILKPFQIHPPDVPPLDQAEDHIMGSEEEPKDPREAFANLLQRSVQQLSAETRHAKLSAYMAVASALEAQVWDVSDTKVFRKYTPPLTQFIQRDLTSKHPTTGNLDCDVIKQALKVLAVLVGVERSTKCLDDDFCRFIVDRSIIVLETPNMPKAVVNHHLLVMHQQNFGKSIMTTGRVDKLVQALQFLESRVKGNNVVGSRIAVYRTLLRQAPSYMTANIPRWMSNVFNGMLSDMKAIRNSAIMFGLKAGSLLGRDPAASSSVLSMLGSPIDAGGVEYTIHVIHRLGNLRAVDEPEVPRVWGAITLFFQGNRGSLQAWKHLKLWLVVIQSCLNSANITTKYAAGRAWNKFVYVTSPDSSTSLTTINMLKNPVEAHLNPKRDNPDAKAIKTIAKFTYVNLLYYALRPDAPTSQIDLYWDHYVHGIMKRMVEPQVGDAASACHILAGLFGAYPTRVWISSRGGDAGHIDPESLPRIEPKWVRANIEKVMSLVLGCLIHAPWAAPPAAPPSKSSDGSGSSSLGLSIASDSSDSSDTCESIETKSTGSRLWLALMKTIAAAGSKEIKASIELKGAVLHIAKCLGEVLESYPSSLPASALSQTWFSKFTSLVCRSVETLGIRIFMDDSFMPRSWGESRPSVKTPSGLVMTDKFGMSPIQYICRLAIQTFASHKELDNDAEGQDFIALMQFCLDQMDTHSGRFGLFRAICLEAVKQTSILGHQQNTVKLWNALEVLATDNLEHILLPADYVNPTSSSKKLPLAYDLLHWGMMFGAPSPAFNALAQKLIQTLRETSGERAGGMLLLESLSSNLVDLDVDFSWQLEYATSILSMVPRFKQSASTGTQEVISGETVISLILDIETDYKETIDMVADTLIAAYGLFNTDLAKSTGEFLTAVGNLIRVSSSDEFQPIFKIQGQVAMWLDDEDETLSKFQGSVSVVRAAIDSLFLTIMEVLETLHTKEAFVISFEALIVSALSSIYPLVAQRMATFIEEKSEVLGPYPDSVQGRLQDYRNTPQVSPPMGLSRECSDSVREEILVTVTDSCKDLSEEMDAMFPDLPIVAKTRYIDIEADPDNLELPQPDNIEIFMTSSPATRKLPRTTAQDPPSLPPKLGDSSGLTNTVQGVKDTDDEGVVSNVEIVVFSGEAEEEKIDTPIFDTRDHASDAEQLQTTTGNNDQSMFATQLPPSLQGGPGEISQFWDAWGSAPTSPAQDVPTFKEVETEKPNEAAETSGDDQYSSFEIDMLVPSPEEPPTQAGANQDEEPEQALQMEDFVMMEGSPAEAAEEPPEFTQAKESTTQEIQHATEPETLAPSNNTISSTDQGFKSAEVILQSSSIEFKKPNLNSSQIPDSGVEPVVVSDSFAGTQTQNSYHGTAPRQSSQDAEVALSHPDQATGVISPSRKRESPSLSSAPSPAKRKRMSTTPSPNPDVPDYADDDSPVLDCIVVAVPNLQATRSNKKRGRPQKKAPRVYVPAGGTTLSSESSSEACSSVPLPKKRKRVTRESESSCASNQANGITIPWSSSHVAPAPDRRDASTELSNGRKRRKLSENSSMLVPGARLAHVEIPSRRPVTRSSSVASRHQSLDDGSPLLSWSTSEELALRWSMSPEREAAEVTEIAETRSMPRQIHLIEDDNNHPTADTPPETPTNKGLDSPQPSTQLLDTDSSVNEEEDGVLRWRGHRSSSAEGIVTPLGERRGTPESWRGRRRTILTPRSILARLRGVLDSCKQLVGLGIADAREIDGVLEEVRSSVREAGGMVYEE